MTIEELLETLPVEVQEAIKQIEHKAGTIDADWEFVKAAGELLAAAKAASVVPVEIVPVEDADLYHGCNIDVGIQCKSEADVNTLLDWLRDRMKERSWG